MTLPMLALLAPIYFVLGAGVKYVDAAYDDNTFSKRYTVLLSIFLGILAGVSMIWDQPTLIIFVSLIIGVAITRKLDILPFRILATIAILLPLAYYRLSFPLSGGRWLLLVILSVGAIIDEIGNDLADAKILKRSTRTFFLYRGYLKIVIILIALLHYLPGKYAIAFLSFDFGYLLLTRLSERRQLSNIMVSQTSTN
jgi:hypothetical protein